MLAPLTYTLITSGDNQPGSHNLTGGSAQYFVELTDPITIRVRLYPNFAYNTGSDQPIWCWYNDSNNYFGLYYSATNDRYEVKWKDGGTERTLNGPTYTDNSHQAWTDIDVVADFANSEGGLYIDRSAEDTSWSGSCDAKGQNYPLFELRSENGSEGDYKINHVRMFLSLEATATQVGNDYKSIKNEEIIWHLNGEGCARTRCNVTRFVQNLITEKSVEEPSSGSAGANRCSLKLLSSGGEFADDQYAAFDPTLDQFNGTSTQKYMRNRCRVEVETWYSNDYELAFTGKMDSPGFNRDSAFDQLQIVNINAEDNVSLIARKFKRKAQRWEDYKLSDVEEDESLVHVLTRLATKDPVYNFLANASFENGTISNSWSVSGTGATFTRQSGGIVGYYQGDLVYGSATCEVAQIVTFLGDKKLNKGETFNFSIYLKATANATGDIAIYEADNIGDNDSTVQAYDTLASATGWDKFEVSHTITDSDSDRLRVEITLETNTTLSLDGAMLVQNDKALNWFIRNTNDGASGIESADDAMYDSYDIVGFDCDYVDIVHPWAIIKQHGNVWKELKQLGDAVGAMYIGLDEAGTFKLRAKLKSGYADPSSLETIDDDEVQYINTSPELARANKLIVKGYKIKKYDNIKVLWSAQAAKIFAEGEGNRLSEQVLDGAIWPSSDFRPFYVKYGFL